MSQVKKILINVPDTLLQEVDALKAEREREVYVNEDGERVPMAQVINEYLYGKEENA